MQSLCWCQLDPVGFALAPSMLTVATENRETMVNSTDVAPEFVGAAYEPMGKIEAGGEQAYEYVAPKEPTDWGTGKRLGMMVGHENYFNSQEAYSKYQEFCEVTKIENIGMIINFYASPTDCDALPNYKIEETTKEHSNFHSACRSLWCADSQRTLNPAPNFTLSIEIQKLPDITMQPILTQRFVIKSYLPNLNQIVMLQQQKMT